MTPELLNQFAAIVGEKHAIRAEDEPLVFLAFLHGAPLAQ